jgi:RimJ/RimL family protein N-acetyltransferase
VPTPEPTVGETDTQQMSDLQLLHKWMNNPRVAKFWGCEGPIDVQEKFLRQNLESKHSFPAIGCWNGRPFGYFEIYWVKEDILGRLLNAGEAKDYDRGVHVLVGEQEFRGAHRLSRWISALIHWALTVDYRTECLVLEPRIDNERYVKMKIPHNCRKVKFTPCIGLSSTSKTLVLRKRSKSHSRTRPLGICASREKHLTVRLYDLTLLSMICKYISNTILNCIVQLLKS